MRTLSLTRPVSVTLNAEGGGTAQAGPSVPGEAWQPSVVSVSVATANAEATASVYAGAAASQPYFVDGSFSGSSGDSTDRLAGRVLYPGQAVFVTWTGGDPGATATMLVQGTRTVPG